MKKHDLIELVSEYRKNTRKKNKNILYHLWSFGVEFVITISVAIIIGFFMDRYLHTNPAFLVLLGIIGFLVALKKIFKNI
jgi:F0F1-type ATP synthase assembly protein I